MFVQNWVAKTDNCVLSVDRIYNYHNTETNIISDFVVKSTGDIIYF